MEWLSDFSSWLKALHVIAVIAWMAGLLYLPRLYVYHCDAAPGSDRSETFKSMERRILRVIINPAMIAAFVFGILLILTPGAVDWSEGWPWVKGAAVIVMAGVHGFYARWRRHFDDDANRHTARFYRLMNEVPTVLMIVIVIMVIVRPF